MTARKAIASTQRKDPHPFFCVVKKIRKTAWDTPEYLTELDRALIARLVTVKTADEFCDVVYELSTPKIDRVGHDAGFFYRIVGWPEGRAYLQNAEYANWVFAVSVKAMVQRAAKSIGLRTEADLDCTNQNNATAAANQPVFQ